MASVFGSGDDYLTLVRIFAVVQTGRGGIGSWPIDTTSDADPGILVTPELNVAAAEVTLDVLLGRPDKITYSRTG